MKIFDGLLDSLYKKWELYLFRLFQLAKYVENTLRYFTISGPDIEELLDLHGCDHSIIRIPPNPFFLRDSDEEIFYMFYDPFECRSEKEKDLKRLLRDIIERISQIKTFIGITKNTRYIGEQDAEKRLCNEIDVYIKFPDYFTYIHKIVLGDPGENIEVLRSFQRFLKDRSHIKRKRSFQQY